MTSPLDSNPPSNPGYEPSQSRPPATPPPPPPGYGYMGYPPPPRRQGIMGRLMTGFFSSLLFLSLGLNVYLGIWFASVMAGPTEAPYAKGDKDNRIVIIPIDGMITHETAQFMHKVLDALRENMPKAVILRVDSGGGGVGASDRIWHELTQFKKEFQVPIVASFGTIAASGAYYISMPADFIIAEPTSLTGSIGVIAEAFTVDSLLTKVGVTPELITATKAVRKDMLSPWRPWTDEDRTALRSILDQSYDRFVNVVIQGRKNLTADQVRQLATGAIYTADEAVRAQLVDSQGYIDAAIDKAKELAGIGAEVEPLVTVISPPHGLNWMSVLGTSMPDTHAATAEQVKRWVGEFCTPRVQYVWPH